METPAIQNVFEKSVATVNSNLAKNVMMVTPAMQIIVVLLVK